MGRLMLIQVYSKNKGSDARQRYAACWNTQRTRHRPHVCHLGDICDLYLTKLDVAAVIFFQHFPDAKELVIMAPEAVRSVDRAKWNGRSRTGAHYQAASRSRGLKFDAMLVIAFYQVPESFPL
jgi:hypothetical protein